jgi:serine/threonine protein kinase
MRGLLIGDRFRVVGEAAIGTGSGGEVWAGSDLRANSADVAVKRLHKSRVKERAREAAAASDPQLANHSLLVAPSAAVTDARFPDTVFVATRRQEHGDLRMQLHRQGPMSLKEARSALADLLIALDFLHRRKGLVHRDVKPENLYWDGARLRLGDFGLARPLLQERGFAGANTAAPFQPQDGPYERSKSSTYAESISSRSSSSSTSSSMNRSRSTSSCDAMMAVSDSGRMTPQMVTLWYRAPEVLLGSTSYGACVDVFSAGAVFGELLAGRPLFKGRTEVDQLALQFKLLGHPSNVPGEWAPDLAQNLAAFGGGNGGASTSSSSSSSSSSASSSSASVQSGGGGWGGGGGGSRTSAVIAGERWSGLAALCPFGTPVPALDLMAKLLSCNPRDRPSAKDALHHPFFWDEPKVAAWRAEAAAHAASQANHAGKAAGADSGGGLAADADSTADVLRMVDAGKGPLAALREDTTAESQEPLDYEDLPPRHALSARKGSISLESFEVLTGENDHGNCSGGDESSNSSAPLKAAADPWEFSPAVDDAASYVSGKAPLPTPTAAADIWAEPAAAVAATKNPVTSTGQENSAQSAAAGFSQALLSLPEAPSLVKAATPPAESRPPSQPPRSQQLGIARAGIPGKARTLSMANKISVPRPLARHSAHKLRDPPAALRPYILTSTKKRKLAPSRL